MSRKNWMTPQQFANYVGKCVGKSISRPRVFQLLAATDEFPDGRIVGAQRVRVGSVVGVLIPPDPQVLHPARKERPGPITDYIEDWEKRHGNRPKDEPKDDVSSLRKEAMSEFML